MNEHLSILILGDFSSDYSKKNEINYAHANLFNDLEEELDHKKFIQLVKFPTLSRLVGLVFDCYNESVSNLPYIWRLNSTS